MISFVIYLIVSFPLVLFLFVTLYNSIFFTISSYQEKYNMPSTLCFQNARIKQLLGQLLGPEYCINRKKLTKSVQAAGQFKCMYFFQSQFIIQKGLQ